MGDSGFQFGKSDVVGLQTIGIRLHFDLTHSTAHVENFSDTGDALQATTNGPVGEGANFGGWQVVRVSRFEGGTNANEENLAHQGGYRRHERLDVGGELFAGGLESFLHEHARLIDVGVPIEFSVDE